MNLLASLHRTCRIPDDLAAVTTIAPDEVRATDLGLDPAPVEAVWTAVERLYRSGLHPAIQLCVRHRGEIVLDRAIGHASGNGPDDPEGTPAVAATPETPFCTLSASKPVTAMLIHLLDQRGHLHVDDPVCEYIPGFRGDRKRWITIRQVLNHRAAMPNLPPGVVRPELLDDPEGILQAICDVKPTLRPGRDVAYHAVVGGFILAEIIRVVTGKSITRLLDEEIRWPLGFRWTGYGVAAEDVSRVARNYATGAPVPPPFSGMVVRMLGMSLAETVDLSNDARFLTAVVPSANVVSTAREMTRFYELLRRGGELDGVRIFDPRTIRRAVAEQSYLEPDYTLVLPIRYSMGFMLGAEWFSLFGPYTATSFGHVGFTNVLTWADPDRQASVVLMTSGKPLVYPQLYWLWEVLRQVGAALPRKAA